MEIQSEILTLLRKVQVIRPDEVRKQIIGTLRECLEKNSEENQIVIEKIIQKVKLLIENI